MPIVCARKLTPANMLVNQKQNTHPILNLTKALRAGRARPQVSL